MPVTPIPSTIMSLYRNVTLGADIMFVNKLPFFVTISRNIKFRTAQLIPDQKSQTLGNAVKHVRSIYAKRGFIIENVFMDGQLEIICVDLVDMQITLNSVARGEHVPELERHIRTIKDRARCVYNALPLNKLPGRVLTELIYYSSVLRLNSFPALDGVSKTMSPRAIIIGSHIDFNKHCKLEFGAYVQAHEEHDNSMSSRTTGALALRPTGNEHGGYFLYSISLTSGRVINRNHWTALPMPADVITRVHTLADRKGIILPDPDDDDGDADDEYSPPTNPTRTLTTPTTPTTITMTPITTMTSQECLMKSPQLPTIMKTTRKPQTTTMRKKLQPAFAHNS